MDKARKTSTDTLVTSVGADSHSSLLKRLFAELGIGEDHLEKYPLNLPGRRLWSDEARGLQLDFKNAWLLGDDPRHAQHEGPWMLTKVVFWGARKKKIPYSHPLPYGVNFQMSRDAARMALLESGFGEARQMGFSDEVDMWTRKGLEVTIDYSGEKDAIRCLTVGVPINRNDT
ncbi:hypothetical protein [Stenotrophomonas rhizophila]|uniref:hypothetical protein n=1 Tax=Stenotrophomonas rhizophila TaxID=216778 RepID=UPI0028D3F7B3|nr:hypothetical protein [Stenotrophomonas rhizophila]